MKLRRRLSVALLSVVCIVAVALCFTGCKEKETAGIDGNIYAVYQSYAIAEVKEGNMPVSYEDWLLTIKGADGKDGVDGIDGVGVSDFTVNDDGELIITYTNGTSANLGVVVGKDDADGDNGLSAYEIAVKNGFSGTEQEWIESFGSVESHAHEYSVTQYGYDCDEDGYLLYECTVAGCNSSYIVHNWRDHLYVDGVCIYCGQYGVTSYSGYVYSSISNSGNAETSLGGATIRLYNGDTLAYETVADSLGYFCFDEITLGSYTVVIINSGYYDINFELNVTTGTGAIESSYYADIVQDSSINGIITIADADMNSSNNVALAGATVNITKLTGTNKIEYTCVTESDGSYSFSHLPAGTYQIVVSKNGYIVLTQNISVAQNQTAVQNMALELITEATGNVTTGNVSGMIYDANVQGNVGVEGLTLYVRAGINITTGAVVQTVYTTANGAYSINLEAGNYTVNVVDERTLDGEDYRYTSSSFNIKVLAGETITNQNGSVSNSISHTAGSLTIILTWGSSPSDLDSHITGPTSNGSRFHVYYGSMTYGSISLDRDDTASYGPETITVSSVEDGIYRYSVHNFSNKSSTSSTNLANSGATVTLYLDGELYATYYVPSGVGTLWTVFEYDSETGTVTPINTLSNATTPSSIS